MDAYFVLADTHAKSALHDVAFSARPDAPVLPYVAPRRRVRGLVASIRSATHRSHDGRSARHARAPGRIVGWHE